ncbi:invasion associated locus B family protein [Jiella avicenniae]|uniref:invasion associated locus B family protein n=1 Tax=Jiella avicenniae TaxID=2907202 RepID=UPI0021020D65|nr:invasion associated locus B family protein [Jiella avicenniae]
MKNASLSKLAGVLVGTATLLAGTPLANAQDANANANAQVLPTEWFKVCTKQGDNDICNTQYSLIAETRQLITAVNLIEVKGKVNQKVMQAVVPTGRVIPPGVQIKVDGNQPQALNYSVCFPNRCIAEAELTDAMIASMKKGSQMVVTSINFQRQANPIPVTLKGFTDAFDGPPKDESALAQRQKELNDALQKQAEERRKRFEDAQNAAKQGGESGTAAQ